MIVSSCDLTLIVGWLKADNVLVDKNNTVPCVGASVFLRDVDIDGLEETVC
jgi:hypothetical protein